MFYFSRHKGTTAATFTLLLLHDLASSLTLLHVIASSCIIFDHPASFCIIFDHPASFLHPAKRSEDATLSGASHWFLISFKFIPRYIIH
jgi:hypothetical protein